MKNDAKKTFAEIKKDLDATFEAQTLKEQAQNILLYLVANPDQCVIPPARVDLLERSLPRFGDIEKQINELADFLLKEFSYEIKEGDAVDNAIRLLKTYKEILGFIDRLEQKIKKLEVL